MKSIWSKVGIAVVLIAITAGAAYAGHECSFKKEDMEKKHEARFQEMCKDLNLSPKQQEQLKQQRKEGMEKAKALHEASRQKWQQLRAELDKPDTTRQGIQPLVNEIKSLKSQMVDMNIDRVFSVKAVLTPEQYQKFQQNIKEKMKSGKKGKYGKWFRKEQ